MEQQIDHTHDIPLKKSKLQGWPKVLLLILLIGLAAIFVLGLLSNERVNVIVMGVEGKRTDTMIFVSIDTKDNSVHAISVPRDTYFPKIGRASCRERV